MAENNTIKQDKEEKAKKSVKIEILEKMSDLATAGLGLVAALAWNEAIKSFFETYFPKGGGSTLAQFTYAIFLTAIIVIVTYRLGKLVDFTKNQLSELEEKINKKGDK